MKIALICFLLIALAEGQSTPVTPGQDAIRPAQLERANLLREFDSSLEQVVSKVSPAVVQILVSGYGPAETHGHVDTARIVRQHALGTGVIVDPDGYVITNAHVVEGAQRIKVILPPPAVDSPIELQPIHAGQVLEAQVVGTHKQSDLALLKIQATHLPTATLRSDVRVHQGELVFAIGTPERLRNTVTMRVVSSFASKLEPVT